MYHGVAQCRSSAGRRSRTESAESSANGQARHDLFLVADRHGVLRGQEPARHTGCPAARAVARTNATETAKRNVRRYLLCPQPVTLPAGATASSGSVSRSRRPSLSPASSISSLQLYCTWTVACIPLAACPRTEQTSTYFPDSRSTSRTANSPGWM